MGHVDRALQSTCQCSFEFLVVERTETCVQPDIKWITAVYTSTGINTDEREHISVYKNARSALQDMANELLETGGQVALYLPETAEFIEIPEEERGRVVGLVELLPMKTGQCMEDFGRDHWDGTRRWPIGWPCRMVCAPPVLQCPYLREHYTSLTKDSGGFGGYVRRFHDVGPFALEARMRTSLNRDFAELCSES